MAQLAAQLICEHGVRDFAVAKRKAARQLGIAEPHHLPGNDEIEAAIKSHQALFQPQAQPELLRELREVAVGIMQMLAEFQPYLTGPALNGAASKYSAIQIELFTDNEKEVELYLLNRNIPFKQGQRQISHLGGRRQIPCFILDNDCCDVYITIQPPAGLRSAPRTSNHEPLKRASLNQLVALLDRSDSAG